MPKFSKPWTAYKIGRFNEETVTNVFHVTHVDVGIKILKEGIIRPSLISDESVLKKERIRVNWVSPNDWFLGYRYGNVRFAFDVNQLMKEKDVYWVEVMSSYNPPAIRFLITNKDHGHPALLKYDIQTEDGPLVRKGRKYYRNKDVTLELMVESDLKLSICNSADFVDHHPTMCGMGNGCVQMGEKRSKAAIRFLAHLLVTDPLDGIDLFLQYDEEASKWKEGEFTTAIFDILNISAYVDYLGVTSGLSADDKLNLLMPFFVYLTKLNKQNFKKCIKIFDSSEEFKNIFFQLITEKIGVNDFSLFDDY